MKSVNIFNLVILSVLTISTILAHKDDYTTQEQAELEMAQREAGNGQQAQESQELANIDESASIDPQDKETSESSDSDEISDSSSDISDESDID